MSAMERNWSEAQAHGARLREHTLRCLFAEDAGRFARLSFRMDDLLVDFSKEKLDRAALGALLDLARAADLEARRDAMFRGEKINLTEDRAVLHTALRDGAGDAVAVDGVDVMPAVRDTRDRFLAFAEDVRHGRYVAVDGAPFTDVVNIGIGGSDLGPAMAARALRPYCDGPRAHFVANVDGADLTDVLADLKPERTLLVVASKTFTTMETMTNARSARAWLADALGEDAGRHVAAVSTNLDATRAFGVDDDRVFGFWDWVGGRYSVWSAIGLPLAIAIGAENFRAFLAGGQAMDAHFRAAPLAENLPVLLGLVGIWRRNVMGWPTVGLMPYSQRLARFPAHIQQVDMESNGKRAQRDGAPVASATAPVVWGEPGTNGQHSFYQLLHQGTDVIPVDFILAANANEALGDHHAKLQANALAQSAALAFGRTEDEARAEMAAAGLNLAKIDRLAPHRAFPGDRPSTTILFDRLDPFAIGRLLALYEHKVFVQGAIWNVNSFDQWGVELGKALADGLLPAVSGAAAPAHDLDGSTLGLLARLTAARDG